MKFKLNKRQKRLLLSTLLAIIILLLGTVESVPEIKQTLVANQPGLYQVLKVNDGDTIVVDMNGVEETIRFIGVDTPETHHPSKPVQCFGRAASEFTTYQLDGQLVRLEADPLNSNRDRYGRLLRYVYLQDGTLLNESVIEEGYGFAYTSFPFTKAEEFEALERLAREENRGLWQGCNITHHDDGRSETDAE